MGRTITLDEDVAERLEAEARRTRKTLDEVVNETVREKLSIFTPKPAKPFRVRAKNMGIRPGVNFECAWKLLDEIDGSNPK